ncbi:MAG: T9SS type A sorting domain-containing protein [Bacteroidota bacterium]
MKKAILALLLALPVISFAQSRMTLHEEFSGENCAPCAYYNPPFWTLCNMPGNIPKIIHIMYMAPIPTSGWYYQQRTSFSDPRRSYYAPGFAPSGRYDGHIPSISSAHPGHIQHFTQAEIDAEAARPDSFSMSVATAWNAAYDTITATVTLTCLTAWTGGAPVLHTALVQTNDFMFPPGDNGEAHFENVVQAMYPTASGQGIASSWTAGSTQTYTVKAAIPQYVDKAVPMRIVTWVQTNANKEIIQAAQSAPLPRLVNDVMSVTTTGPPRMVCTTGGYNVTHTVKLRNTGSATLTNANIYYRVNNGPYSIYPWSGSLATMDSIVVSIPMFTMAVAGSTKHFLYDSIGMPNSTQDFNPLNSVSYDTFFIENTVGMQLPYNTSFESLDTQYYCTDKYHSMYQTFKIPIWEHFNIAGIGHTGSRAAGYLCGHAVWMQNDNIIALPQIRVPVPVKSTLTFWEAYTRTLGGYQDSLQVVYSPDCGATWVPIWTLTGSTMVSMPASYAVPASPSHYAKRTVSLADVPAGNVLLGFRAVRSNGNCIFVDDINVTSTVVGVEDLAPAACEVNLYPNPATDNITVQLSLSAPSAVNIQMLDAVGRTIATYTEAELQAGAHDMQVSAAAIVPGIYQIVVRTNAGSVTRSVSVTR